MIGRAIERSWRHYKWRQRLSLDFATVVVLAAPGLFFALYQGTAIENTLGEIDLFGLGFAAGACLGIPVGYVLRSFLPYRGVVFGTILGLALWLGAGVIQLNRDVPDAARSTQVTRLLVDWQGSRERLRIGPELWRGVSERHDRIELTTYAGRVGWTVVEAIRVAP